MSGPIQTGLYEALSTGLDPEFLVVTNESHRHNVPPGSESHFKVVVVTAEFDGQRLIKRHQRVNQLLARFLANDIHALAMHTYTPEEWREKGEIPPLSPNCLGGARSTTS